MSDDEKFSNVKNVEHFAETLNLLCLKFITILIIVLYTENLTAGVTNNNNQDHSVCHRLNIVH